MQSSSQTITTNKPTSSFLQTGCPSCHPINSVKVLKGIQSTQKHGMEMIFDLLFQLSILKLSVDTSTQWHTQ